MVGMIEFRHDISISFNSPCHSSNTHQANSSNFHPFLPPSLSLHTHPLKLPQSPHSPSFIPFIFKNSLLGLLEQEKCDLVLLTLIHQVRASHSICVHLSHNHSTSSFDKNVLASMIVEISPRTSFFLNQMLE